MDWRPITHQSNRLFNQEVQMMKCLVLALAVCGMICGCAGRSELLPNKNPALRKTAAEFAADAAKRFPYKAAAARGGTAKGRAQVGYTLNRLEVVNLSDEVWNDVEIWINSEYVVSLPTMKPNELQSMPFQAIYNDRGQSFPTNNSKVLVNKVEVFMGGKMWDVPKQQAD
jgi:hypothetical protein